MGDHLTRDEFERRYTAMPYLKKAELIEGVVYTPSPVYRSHAWAHSQIMGWLATYCASTPSITLYDNVSIRLDMDNEVQPDVALKVEVEAERPSLSKEHDSYLETVPELIVEVAASSASYDLYEKLHVYRRNRVQEYLVWQLYENQLDWFCLVDGKYIDLTPGEQGYIHSRAFPGLRLDVNALLDGNLAQVLAVLQQGIQTDAHAAFVEYLQPKT
jgi:Uma2 family endonuclease